MPTLIRPRILTSVPGPNSKTAARELENHEGAGVSAILKGAEPIFCERAFGMLIEDIDGNRFLDCSSSFGVASIGYCHPEVKQSVSQQINVLTHTMQGPFSHLPYLRAVESITQMVGRNDQNQAMIVNSGSEAIEVALKLSSCFTGKPGIISFRGAFHGQSLGALEVTSINNLRDTFSRIISNNVVWVPYPNPYRPMFGLSSESLIDMCLDNIEQILQSNTTGGAPIGAILVEPMQNAAGYIIPPEGFLSELRRLCSQYEVLLICDEIFTGFGRNGYWLSADREQVVPDIVCVGKGMTGGYPVAAVVAPRSIMESMSHDGIIPLHGSTFGGNAVACAAINATIKVLHREDLVVNAHRMGSYLKEKIQISCEALSRVGDVRGLGLAIAIEFVTDRSSKERDVKLAWQLNKTLINEGIITLVTGLPYGNILAICPPLIITTDVCDFVADKISQCIRQIANKA